MSKYRLDAPTMDRVPESTWAAFAKLIPLMRGEGLQLVWASLALSANTALTLLGPWLIGRAIDRYVVTGDYPGLWLMCGLLLATYIGTLVASYVQMRVMGTIGQRVLFGLRNRIFTKLQELPVSFFGQNKIGDLIARISGDAQALNEFFAYQLMSFVGAVMLMVGASIALVLLDWRIGLIALLPGIVLVAISWILSPWTQRRNRANREVLGALSGEIAESFANFKVIVAFGRQDYFKRRFDEVNQNTYNTAMAAGYANALFQPIYALAGSFGLLAILAYGIHLVGSGALTLGILIAALGYAPRVYDPVRQIGAMWMSLQTALAAWDRITPLLKLTTDLHRETKAEDATKEKDGLISFDKVSFTYEDGASVLNEVSFTLERGKSYALVGPTGGGKTTTASLMARLIDPTSGTITFGGVDLRTLSEAERAARIGCILQDPFLFSGTVKDNIVYSNARLEDASTEEIHAELSRRGMSALLERFDNGLETAIGAGISLGQRQLIAFIRALLRDPELLILDEATANIDTITEAQLEHTLTLIPPETTRVTIAHRLNTIAAADEIFFVNNGSLTPAGSFDQAVEMLMHNKRVS